jgi:hypothetical protein
METKHKYKVTTITGVERYIFACSKFEAIERIRKDDAYLYSFDFYKIKKIKV